MNISASAQGSASSNPPPANVPHSQYDNASRLFDKYFQTRDPALRDRLVHDHERLARYLASKFAGRGEPVEDLVQVANIGLIKAVDRYDPTRGLKFATYATATVVGEIQRYFRDTGWRMKVPRALKELNQAAAKAKDTLTIRFSRVPTVAEVALEIGASEEATLEAIELTNSYIPMSLDGTADDPEAPPLTERIGSEDPAIQALLANAGLHAALASLDLRLRLILIYYFFHELTQLQIAERLGVSQMHVSRLKDRALTSLRHFMSSDAAGGEPLAG